MPKVLHARALLHVHTEQRHCRLALSGSKPMEWVATERDVEYVPPELSEGARGAAQGETKTG